LLLAAPALLVVANRTQDKAQALAQSHATVAEEHGVQLRVGSLGACGSGFDVVVNATASSLKGDQVPVDAAVLAPGSLALDMMYGPSADGFLAWAKTHGATPRDGLGMLVEQAAEAFHAWRGVRPDTAPVLQALRERVAQKAKAA
jgi:shikimate dehydrogenase